MDDEHQAEVREGLASPEEATPEEYPKLRMLPSSVLWSFVPVPEETLPPEFVFVPCPDRDRNDEESHRIRNFIFDWNLMWEAAQVRGDFFETEIPPQLGWLRRYHGSNVCLLPDSAEHKYDAYAPLFHLLPRRTLERFGLPVLERGNLPAWDTRWRTEPHVDATFDQRLSRAFAHHIWPLIDDRSYPSQFSATEPLLMLSHNLNYWLPFAYQVIEARMRTWERVPLEPKEKRRYRKLAPTVPEGISAQPPRYGGTIWQGEVEAREVTREILATADRNGQLRGIMQAIRSNRVADDFSGIWSRQKEDFERKLYHKRNKVKVTFVQLDDTIPLHGPTSEVHDNLLWEDFEALLDVKERRVTVLLRSGHTKMGEIGKALGYANHSPISKALARIREKAAKFLDLD